MALTYTVAKAVEGSTRVHYVTFTTDNSYAAGGYTLAASDFEGIMGLGYNTTNGTSVVSFVSEKNAAGYSVALDKTNAKLKVFTASAEATTTTSTQVVTARIAITSFNK